MLDDVEARTRMHSAKLKMMGYTEETFAVMSLEVKKSALNDLLERVRERLDELLSEESETRMRKDQLGSILAADYQYIGQLRMEVDTVLRLQDRYRVAVHAQRSAIGRYGAYVGWSRRFERIGNEVRAQHYRELAAEARAVLPARNAEVVMSREELRDHSSLISLTREIAGAEASLSHDNERVTELEYLLRSLTERTSHLFMMSEEITKEIAEIERGAVEVFHHFREVYIEILAAYEYSAARSGSDIDIEISAGAEFKTLLPTRFVENESAWLESVRRELKTSMCRLTDECLTSEYFAVTEDADVRCNLVEAEIRKRTVSDVSRQYEGLRPPVEDKVVERLFRKELGRFIAGSVTLLQVMRSNALGQSRSYNSSATSLVRACLSRRINEILIELEDSAVKEELPVLLEMLSK
jgi:hypothetical protein